MDNSFFEHSILNSPYDYPGRHWELDPQGQPTQRIVGNRRPAEFITPIPKPRKRKGGDSQIKLGFDDLSTAQQQYDPNPLISELRGYLDRWRALKDPGTWGVTPKAC